MLSEEEHGESCNYLGDAYLGQYMSCIGLPQKLRELAKSGNLDEKLSDQIKQFHRQFRRSMDKRFSSITPEDVENRANEAKENGK